MPYVTKEDLIAYIPAQIDFTQGDAQSYTITMYINDLTTQLNVSNATNINIALYNKDGIKELQFSEPAVAGISSGVTIGSGAAQGEVTFNITTNQALSINAGRLDARVTVFYESFSPAPKTYILPFIQIGTVASIVGEGGGGTDVGEGINSVVDLDQTPSNTSGDGSDSGLIIENTPWSDSNVQVIVNGIGVVVGDGNKNEPCYFSGDNGANARSIIDITATDKLYWNATYAGFELDNTDTVTFIYEQRML